MVDRFQVIAQRLAAHGNAVFNQLRRLAQGQRIAFDGIGRIG